MGIQTVPLMPFFPSAVQHLWGLNRWQQSSKTSIELIWLSQGLNGKRHHPGGGMGPLEGSVLTLPSLNRLGFRLQY
ncbi:hypothetical protein [Laspinema olomoucense]|uniref:Uncharacterized protein n=1 Tax=Laspinema olomoucense D3b TaxID=2953688 RepID=A0ABT2NFT3_9CYAN|nr:hypothetical protein [Laspinema sp. D3b]MCT7981565.1 hypothetical protein [Laspinema sp. D3b]